MKRLKINNQLLDSVDKFAIEEWLRGHDLPVEWMPLEQTLEFDVGHIWYDLYQHTISGELIFRDNHPAIRRVLHTCTLKCCVSTPHPLTDYRIEENDDDTPSDPDRP